MSREAIEQKLLERLEHLFQRESFGIEVIVKRATIGIPITEGFASHEAYLKWLKKHRSKFFDIQSARAELARQFKIPFQHSLWLEAYLILGKNFKTFDQTVPFNMGFKRGHDIVSSSCALEFDSDNECVNIQILPGASGREISRFIGEHKNQIEKFLSTFERRVEPTRTKRKAERDTLIYALHKKGWLDRYGQITELIDDPKVLGDMARINLDYRRKIIGTQLKLRK